MIVLVVVILSFYVRLKTQERNEDRYFESWLLKEIMP